MTAHDTYNISATPNFLGLVTTDQKDYDAARAAFEEALALARRCGYDVPFRLS